MTNPVTQFQNNKTILLLLGITLVFSLVGIVAAIYTTLVPAASPFRYSNLRINPDVICAGQPLTYDVDVDVTRAPVSVGVTENVWDVTNQRIAMGGQELHWAIFLQVAHIRYTRVLVTLPLLPPGLYEYRRAGSELNSLPTFAAAPFTVTACP